MSQPLVWKFIHWISSLTVEKFDFTAGTRQGSRNLVGFGMVTRIYEYVKDEVELVLKLGLMCCNTEPLARPTMQQVVQYLEGHAPLPELSTVVISSAGLAFEPFSNIAMSNYSSSSTVKPYSQPPSLVADSIFSGGR